MKLVKNENKFRLKIAHVTSYFIFILFVIFPGCECVNPAGLQMFFLWTVHRGSMSEYFSLVKCSLHVGVFHL